ncbi:MAG: glycosyltransferase family 61 protein [Muribaculaceae bacterium]|nr:glycosyltransferase family 61 protein [Muribaculaceae bacterium]
MQTDRIHLYMPDIRKKEFFDTFNKIKFENVTEIQSVPNGIIKALERKHGRKTLGVFDENLRPVKSAELRWDNILLYPQKIANLKKSLHKIPVVNEDVVYLGNTISHFGHFMINTLDRAWSLVQKKYKVALICTNSEPRQYHDLLHLMGIDEKDIIIVTESTRFQSVLIPQRGFLHKEFISPEWINIFKHISNNVNKTYPYDKIYVSRCKFVNTNNPSNLQFGEQKIENIFRKNGYHVIYPEHLSITDQIAYMKNCRSLAGVAGTALHLALFMPDNGQVIQIQRSKRGFPFAQAQINTAKNMDSYYIDASIEKYITTHSTLVPQIIGVTEHLKQFMDEQEFVYNDTDIEFDSTEYNKYISACHKMSRLKFIQSRWIKILIKRFIHIICYFVPNRSLRHKLRGII